MGRKRKEVSQFNSAQNALPSPIPDSQQPAITEDIPVTPAIEVAGPPMPRSSQFPCPRCGQPMKQNGKSGMDLYYYCRGFGPAISCGFPGKTFSTRERYEHELKQDVHRARWTFDEKEGRYQFVIEE